MIAEAFDTLRLLIIAGGVWFIAGAVALGLVLALFLIALHAAARATWRALTARTRRPSWARTRSAARRYARRSPDYEEAA
ncbi:hypothetical protein [Streptomyces sp. ME01-18h]|uniref:hypothetical protein n=1 Tax=Streptomyces sp. ME01-18h TaxID=462920 RepID=UPI0029B32A54|nr:hypothetical protein [Streptomyces sp. ME01-18h]MDX3398412.1 hypothetical protein [Streptomyces sp. ME01-18h]